MLFNFPGIVKKNKLDVRGIIQVGASVGEEVEMFNNWPSVFIEPQNKAFNELIKKTNNAYNELITDKDGEEVTLHIAEFPTCSSIYTEGEEFGVVFSGEENHISKTLKTFINEHNLQNYNCLVLDVEGSEFDVLEGADLNQFDYIFVEFHNSYKNTEKNLKDYLSKTYKFIDKVYPTPEERSYGDMFFIRK